MISIKWLALHLRRTVFCLLHELSKCRESKKKKKQKKKTVEVFTSELTSKLLMIHHRTE